MARALTRTPGRGSPPRLVVAERAWLRELAQGSTVTALARTAGYSEREMYRLLAKLYTRLAATGRTEALLAAERWGLLDPDPT